MPILQNFALPKAIGDLTFPAATEALFIAFLASKDPATKKPWCPDVVAALPTLEATFTGAKKPQVAFVEVGQRPEWRDPKNIVRTAWNVNNVPALVRYEKTADGVKEVERLIEGEILDEERLNKLLGSPAGQR